MEKKVICTLNGNNYVFDAYSTLDLTNLKDYLTQVIFFLKSKSFLNKFPPQIKVLTGTIPFGDLGDKHFDYLSFVQEIEKEKYIIIDNRLKKEEFISEILLQIISQMFFKKTQKEKYEITAKIVFALIQNYDEFITKKHLFENKKFSPTFLSLKDLNKTLKHLIFIKDYAKQQINQEPPKSFAKVVLASILISFGLTPLVLNNFLTGAVISESPKFSFFNLITLASFFLGISIFLIPQIQRNSGLKIIKIYDYPILNS